MIGRPPVAALALACGLGLLASCAENYSPTPDITASPASAPASTAAEPPPVTTTCPDGPAVASYTPPQDIPRNLAKYPTVAEIKRRGRLVVGVSSDMLLLGARDAKTGAIRGFDIEMAGYIADEIFGTRAGHLTFQVMTADKRIPALQSGSVDLIARAMTITCSRWNEVAFSAEYYSAKQSLLVEATSQQGPGPTKVSLADMRNKRVCAPQGTTNLATLQAQKEILAVPTDSDAACMTKFQRGDVDAIYSDDVILAGLAAQDPYARVASQPIAEPYGLGFPLGSVDFVKYANAVLARIMADGRWLRAYNANLAPVLGPAPRPPTPIYQRKPLQ
ncbi:MAG: transporter substrate-binding domain-containing protein [Angustibacter sp.]